MRKVLTDPLLHFVAVGALLFALVPGEAEAPASGDSVDVPQSAIDRLKAEHRRATGREPGPDELRGLVRSHVEEELLVRRARELGLDRGDPIVRRRLAEKTRLLLRGTVREPGEDELAAWLQKHPERYGVPATRSFEHVFVRAAEGAAERAEALSRQLATGTDPTTLGDAFLQGRRLVAAKRSAVAAAFGDAFADALWRAPVDTWTGPLASAHGQHLVRVTATTEPRIAELDAVRDRVRADWLEARRAEAERAALEALRERAGVEVTR